MSVDVKVFMENLRLIHDEVNLVDYFQKSDWIYYKPTCYEDIVSIRDLLYNSSDGDLFRVRGRVCIVDDISENIETEADLSKITIKMSDWQYAVAIFFLIFFLMIK